ncbi:hypothetical protein G5632_35340, partial [Escherichia coli]|nr:hypothetical protein [Escherichia coli]
AFVIAKDQSKQVFFTERFFDQQLHQYTHLLTEPFDIDGHARAATLIHEFAHLYTHAHDISTAESRRPFSDLIEILTVTGRLARDSLQQIQREALSLATPRHQLFSRWNDFSGMWESFDSTDSDDPIFKAVQKSTGSTT